MADLTDFLDGVEESLHSNPPWRVFMPQAMARDEGASDPPAGLEDPVWTEETGWEEKADVIPPHFVWTDAQPRNE